MRQSAKIKLGGGGVNGLTPDTVLYGKGENIKNLDYNNISINPLIFQSPLSIINSIDNNNSNNDLTTFNYVSIDLSNYDNSNVINSKLTLKQNILKPIAPVLIDNDNISIDLSASGWTSNISTNIINTTSLLSKIGIGTTEPNGKLHIYSSSSIANDIIISKYNNNIIIGYDADLNFTMSTSNNNINKQFYINATAPNNSLYIDKNGITNIIKLNANGQINALSYSSNGIPLDFTEYALKTELINIDFENKAIKCIGSNIVKIDYNNITINRPIFNSNSFITDINTNNISINPIYLGWNNNSINNNIYVLQSNIGIGTSIPLGNLHIGSVNTKTDGTIIISKTDLDNITNNINYNYNFKIGYDNLNNISIGSYININNIYVWKKHIIITNNSIENALVINNSNIGIGNNNPLGILHIGSHINNSDGNIIISKKTGLTNNNFKIGYDNLNIFSLGSFLNINNNYHWTKQLLINPQAPESSLYINNIGNIGFGTSIPLGYMHIGSTSKICDGNIIISKTFIINNDNNDNIINSNIKIGYDDFNNISIGSYTISNNNIIWKKNITIIDNSIDDALVINNSNIGIGTSLPLGSLHIGSTINKCNSTIILSKTENTNINVKLGYDENNFCFGSYSKINNEYLWNKQLLIHSLAPFNSLTITNNGIGIGKNNDISYKLDVNGSIRTNENLYGEELYISIINGVKNIYTNDIDVINNINCSTIVFNNSISSNINNKYLLETSNIITNHIDVLSNINCPNIISDYLHINSNIITSNFISSNIITDYIDINSNINSLNINTSNITTEYLISNSNIFTKLLNVNNIISSNIYTNIITTSNIYNSNSLETLNIYTSNIIIDNRIGINNNNPIARLHIGNVLNNNDNLLILSANNKNFRFGYNNSNFVFGDFSNNIWINQFSIHSNAPSNSLVINNNGYIGIGTINPNYNLDIDGSLNALSIFKNGNPILSSIEINNSISTALIPYLTTAIANNTYTSNSYLSSTLQTLENNISLRISKAFTIDENVYNNETRFPPNTFELDTFTHTGNNTINYRNIGKCYKASFIVNSLDAGDGLYNIYTSSTRPSNLANISNLFDYTLATANNPYSFDFDEFSNIVNSNNIARNTYIGSNYIQDDTYKGEFIVVELPKPIILTRFRFYINTNPPTNNINKAPSSWRCYASNDAITFEHIIAASSFITTLNRGNYRTFNIPNNTNTIRYYELTISRTLPPYKYYAFVINRLIDANKDARNLVLSRLELYGRELLKPIFISSNVLENYLSNYSTKNELITTSNVLKDYLEFTYPLTRNGNRININLENILISGSSGSDSNLSNLSNLIVNYINSRIDTDIWIKTPNNNLYYNNGVVNIGTTVFNTNYLLNVNGNIKANDIYCDSINATSLYGNGSAITNINYNNLINLPNLNNIGAWIYAANNNVYSLLSANVGIGTAISSSLNNRLTVIGNIYSSSNIIAFNNFIEGTTLLSNKYLQISAANLTYLPLSGGRIITLGINTQPDITNTYFLNVNGSILSSNNINALQNIQENGVNLSSKYLTINNAINNYLSINGGSIYSISINTPYDINNIHRLYVNGSILSTTFINAIENLQENGINLSSKYLTINNASLNYLPLTGGTLTSSLIINGNIGIGTTNISSSHRLNVNGSIFSSNNIHASGDFIENGINLSSKYLTINNASLNYLPLTGGTLTSSLIINGNIGIGTTNILSSHRLNVNGSIFSSNNIHTLGDFIENGINLSSKYLTINNASLNYLPLTGGTLTSSLIINGNIIIGNENDKNKYLFVGGNIKSTSNIYIDSNIYTSNLQTSNINNLGSLNTTGNININNGSIIQNGGNTNTFSGNIIIGNENDNDKNKYLFVGGNIKSTSNIYIDSNIYTSNLQTSNINNLGSLNTTGNININGGSIIQNEGNTNTFSGNIIIGNENDNDKNKYLFVGGNIKSTSNIYIDSNIYTSNLQTSNINNNGSLNTTGNININGGSIIQNGGNTNSLSGNVIIGNENDKNKYLFVGGNIKSTSNIYIDSNVYTSNLQTLNINNLGSLNTTGNININNGSITQNGGNTNTFSGNIIIGNENDKNKYLFVGGNIKSTSNIYIDSNIYTSNLQTSNINNLGSLNTTGNININGGSIIQNGGNTNTLSGNVIIGNENDKNKYLFVGGNIKSTSNIYIDSNIYTSNLQTSNINISNNLISNKITANYIEASNFKSLLLFETSNINNFGFLNIFNDNININGGSIIQNGGNTNLFSGNIIIGNENDNDKNKYLFVGGNIKSTSNIYIDSNIYTSNLQTSNITNIGSLNTNTLIIRSNITQLTESDIFLSGNVGIGTTSSVFYKLFVNGNLCCLNNIITYGNFQENGVDINAKYLSIINASNTYLPLNGGVINNNLGIGTTASSFHRLNVNGNINTTSNFIENGVRLIDKYLTLTGGIITSNLNINSNLGIGTSASSSHRLNVNGDIYTSNNFIENGVRLIDKYLTITGGIITSNLGIGTSASSSHRLNVNGDIYTSNNFIENGVKLVDKYFQSANFDNEVLNNQPNLQKKFGIRVACNTEVILNNIKYYKHDINLALYTKLKNDTVNANSYRVFSLKCFSTTAIFNSMILNKTPNILQYDIYMSDYNNSISVCAIGFPNNYYLNKITSGDIFILKTNNFNYISILSKTINTSINCILSDFLF